MHDPLKLALAPSDVNSKGRWLMVERWWKVLQGFRIAFQFWWLNRSVERLRKTVLRRTHKHESPEATELQRLRRRLD